MSYLHAVNDAVRIATKTLDQLENAGAKAFHGFGDVRMPAFGHDRESTPEFELPPSGNSSKSLRAAVIHDIARVSLVIQGCVGRYDNTRQILFCAFAEALPARRINTRGGSSSALPCGPPLVLGQRKPFLRRGVRSQGSALARPVRVALIGASAGARIIQNGSSPLLALGIPHQID